MSFSRGDKVVRDMKVPEEEIAEIGIRRNNHLSWFYENPIMVVWDIFDRGDKPREVLVHKVGKENNVISVDEHMILPVNELKTVFEDMKRELDV